MFQMLQGDERARELERLQQLPRYTPTTTMLLGKPLEIVDAASFLWTVPIVIERGMYQFPSIRPNPLIVDGGSNIGLSCIFFKQLYPESRILAFEPDSKLFSTLERNLEIWGCDEIELNCCALWTADGELTFMSEGADAGRFPQKGDTPNCVVRSVRLRDYLQEPVDMLKLELEGAETDVLLDCADVLSNVRNLYVGYHSFGTMPQTLHVLLGVLADQGFRVNVEGEKVVPNPLMNRPNDRGIDAHAVVFACRPGPSP